MTRFAAIALALTTLLVGPEARAAFTITFNQVGNDVVATASGSLNITGLDFVNTGGAVPGITPTTGNALLGPTGTPRAGTYVAFFTGPENFGAGGSTSASFGAGDAVGLARRFSRLILPEGYISGASLSATSTFANQTFASLGLAQGTFAFSYSAAQGGPTIDTITVQVGPAAAVPEPASMAMVGLGLAGVGVITRRRSIS